MVRSNSVVSHAIAPLAAAVGGKSFAESARAHAPHEVLLDSRGDEQGVKMAHLLELLEGLGCVLDSIGHLEPQLGEHLVVAVALPSSSATAALSSSRSTRFLMDSRTASMSACVMLLPSASQCFPVLRGLWEVVELVWIVGAFSRPEQDVF